MLGVLVLLVVIASVVVFVSSRNFFRVDNTFFTALLGLVFAAIITGCTALGTSYDKGVVTGELVALNDGTSVSGSFFLGIGGFSEDAKYTYYVADKDGSYHLETTDADSAQVAYIEDGVTPYVSLPCDINDAPSWVMWPIPNEDRTTEEALAEKSVSDCPELDLTFYVPKGSISSDIVLDAK